jgi:membrane protease YdiL (CAAX protease family)
VLFQLLYTSVFGWYATWLFLRTQSLWGIVIVHSFCNWIGLPKFSLMVRVSQKKEETTQAVKDERPLPT